MKLSDNNISVREEWPPFIQSLFVCSGYMCLRATSRPPTPFTQHKAELDGLLFDMGVRLCDVGAAAAEGVCQN